WSRPILRRKRSNGAPHLGLLSARQVSKSPPVSTIGETASDSISIFIDALCATLSICPRHGSCSGSASKRQPDSPFASAAAISYLPASASLERGRKTQECTLASDLSPPPSRTSGSTPASSPSRRTAHTASSNESPNASHQLMYQQCRSNGRASPGSSLSQAPA